MDDTLRKILNNLADYLVEDLKRIDGVSNVKVEMDGNRIKVKVYSDYYDVDYDEIVRFIQRDIRIVRDFVVLDAYIYFTFLDGLYVKFKIDRGNLIYPIEIIGEFFYDQNNLVRYVNEARMGIGSFRIIHYIKKNWYEVGKDIAKAYDYIKDVINTLSGLPVRLQVFDTYSDNSSEKRIYIVFSKNIDELNNKIIRAKVNDMIDLLRNLYDTVHNIVYESVKEKAVKYEEDL